MLEDKDTEEPLTQKDEKPDPFEKRIEYSGGNGRYQLQAFIAIMFAINGFSYFNFSGPYLTLYPQFECF